MLFPFFDSAELHHWATIEWNELRSDDQLVSLTREHFRTLDDCDPRPGSRRSIDADRQQDAWHETMFLGEQVKLAYQVLAEFWVPQPDPRALHKQGANKLAVFQNPYGHKAVKDQALHGHSHLVGTIAAYGLLGHIDPLRVDDDSRFAFSPLPSFVDDEAAKSPWRVRDVERVQQALALGDNYFMRDAGPTRATPGHELP